MIHSVFTLAFLIMIAGCSSTPGPETSGPAGSRDDTESKAASGSSAAEDSPAGTFAAQSGDEPQEMSGPEEFSGPAGTSSGGEPLASDGNVSSLPGGEDHPETTTDSGTIAVETPADAGLPANAADAGSTINPSDSGISGSQQGGGAMDGGKIGYIYPDEVGWTVPCEPPFNDCSESGIRSPAGHEVCVAGYCVECGVSSDCLKGDWCDKTTFTCKPAAEPNPAEGKFPCSADKNCYYNEFGLKNCDTSSGFCVECTDNYGCPEAKCDLTTRRCYDDSIRCDPPCGADSYCADDGKCRKVGGYCGGCESDADCVEPGSTCWKPLGTPKEAYGLCTKKCLKDDQCTAFATDPKYPSACFQGGCLCVPGVYP